LTYYFRIAAVNTIGTGAYSSPSVTAIPGVTPSAPTLSTPTPGSTQVSLSWTGAWIAGAISAGSITDWVVQYSTNNSTWTTFSDDVSTTTSATVTGLTNGTLYYFRVAGLNPATTGTYTSGASATPRTTPNAPVFTTLTPGNTQIVVSWSAPANGGSAITDYDLEYSSNSGSTWTAWASGTTSTATSVTVTGLTNGTAYVFRVLAKNVAGSSSNSSTSSSSTPRTVPTTPGQPVLTAGDRQILVTWTAPSSNGGSAITDYTIERYPNIAGSLAWGGITDGVSTATTFTNTGLTNGQAYYYRVYAVNAAGSSVVSTQSNWVAPVGTTVAPTSVAGTAGNTQVSLTWTAPASNGGTISDYTIQYSSDSGSTWTTFSDTVSATASVTVTGLTNGTAYVFRVAATNQAGLGAYSSNSAVRTPVGAPGAPTNLVGVAGNAQVALTWTAPVSNGGSVITDYVIRYATAAAPTSWTTFTDTVSTATSVTVTGLTNGTPYVFSVAAKNAVGTGSYSTNSSSVTPLTVPNAPTSVSASSGARQSDAVRFTAPANNGGSAITGYAVRFSVVNSDVWSTATLTGSTSTSFTQTGLTPATSYIFQVAAINAAGQGAWSANSASVVIQDFAAAPTGVTGVVGNTQVALSWTAPTNNGGNAISDYDVQYSSNNGASWTPFSHTASTATSLTVTGLTNGVD
jgi:titin